MPILILLQYFLGLVIYNLYNPAATKRPIRNQVHRVLAPAIIILGLADCVLGFIRWGQILPAETHSVAVSFWTFVAFTAISYVVLFAAGESLKRRFEMMSKRTGFETTWKVSGVAADVADEKGRDVGEKQDVAEVGRETTEGVQWDDVTN